MGNNWNLPGSFSRPNSGLACVRASRPFMFIALYSARAEEGTNFVIGKEGELLAAHFS